MIPDAVLAECLRNVEPASARRGKSKFPFSFFAHFPVDQNGPNKFSGMFPFASQRYPLVLHTFRRTIIIQEEGNFGFLTKLIEYFIVARLFHVVRSGVCVCRKSCFWSIAVVVKTDEGKVILCSSAGIALFLFRFSGAPRSNECCCVQQNTHQLGTLHVHP